MPAIEIHIQPANRQTDGLWRISNRVPNHNNPK